MSSDTPLVLGFNSMHDAAAAIVRGGEVLLAVEEERLSRVKHHYGVPARAMDLCLEAAGTTWRDLEHVAFFMDPGLWLRASGWHFLKNLPRSAGYLLRKRTLLASYSGVERKLRATTGFRGRFHPVEHHSAHIDSAFWPSGFTEAAALTIDGAGESVTSVLARVTEHTHERLLTTKYPISVGKVWECVTTWLGWKHLQDEGKVMGLAPYGSERFVDGFRNVLRPDPKRGFVMDLAYFNFQVGGRGLVSERFCREFGPPRTPGAPLEDHHRDVARALQHWTEEVVLSLARMLRERSGLSRLVMAGGVALNCVANGRLARAGIFDEIFIQPAAADSGAGLGAALLVSHRTLGAPRGPAQRHAFLGPGFTDDEVDAAATRLGLEAERPADVVERTAELLAEGHVLGWMQGRTEYGPRALGNRSILADPRSAEMTERVNRLVKFREPFRPFAPSVTAEAASEWFDLPTPSPYMLLAGPVREEQRARIPSVTHVDGTARVQTVTRESNPRYHALLEAFARRTGVPVLLNTSFNVRGEPIVNTPEEALQALLRTGLTAVVIGDLIFRSATV